jgi:transcriptional regulator with XRE-family HTH domain
VSAGRKINSVRVALKFGDNLRRCRTLAGLSQEELAERASLHRTEVAELESGERIARIDTLLQLAEAMAIRPEDLIAGISWIPGEAGDGDFSIGTTPRQSSAD